MNSKALILGLHRVGYPPKNARIRGLFVTPRLLHFQLALLSWLGFQFSTLKDAIMSPTGKTAVITFDDGYEDNFTAALPVLELFAAPATIFVVTDDIGKKSVVWDEADEKNPADMISWDMLAELAEKGWEIGSHGHHHVRFADKEVCEQEFLVSRSVKEIESTLGIVPISFAYPYGAWSETTKSVLRRSGIRFAVTTMAPTSADLYASQDLLELKRVTVGGRHFYHFFKVTWRIFKAIGFSELIGSFPFGGIIRFAQDRMSKRRF